MFFEGFDAGRVNPRGTVSLARAPRRRFFVAGGGAAARRRWGCPLACRPESAAGRPVGSCGRLGSPRYAAADTGWHALLPLGLWSFATGALASSLRRRGGRLRRALHRLGASRRRRAPARRGVPAKIFRSRPRPTHRRRLEWDCRGDSADLGFGRRPVRMAVESPRWKVPLKNVGRRARGDGAAGHGTAGEPRGLRT